MTVAADTREALRSHPFLEKALRAGVVNYTAAARFLDCGDEEAVAAALRRYAAERDPYSPHDRRVSVSMRSGLGRTTDPGEPLLFVGEIGYTPDGGRATAVVATGDVDAEALATVLGRLRTAETPVEAAGVADDSLVVVVERRDGANAVRAIEDAL